MNISSSKVRVRTIIMIMKQLKNQHKIGVQEIELTANITMKVQVYNLILDSLNHTQRGINLVYGV